MSAIPTATACTQQAAQQIYEREFALCARSPEWKAGALRGLRRAAGLAVEPSPYKSGTAQDDAWLTGNLVGRNEWGYRAARGQLPGQSGWDEPRQAGAAA